MDEVFCDYMKKFLGSGVLVHWNGAPADDPLGNPMFGVLAVVGDDFIVLTVSHDRKIVIPKHAILTIRFSAEKWG